LNQPDPELLRELTNTTIVFTAIVLVGTFFAYRAFVNWQKRDKAKREKDSEHFGR